MKRLMLFGGVAVLALVVGVVIFVFTGLDAAIKSVVETVGSRATGTPVKLKSVEVSLKTGTGHMSKLTVDNPKGYATSNAFELGDIQVVIDTSTVMSDVVVIKQVVIEAPHVTYEVGPGGSNVGVIQANVDAFAKTFGAGGADEPKVEKKTEGRKFIIKDLQVRAGRVDVSASVLGGRKAGATLGAIHLTNIGTAEGGATAAEIAEKLLAALTDSAIDSVKGLGIDALKDSFEGYKKKFGEGLGDKLKGVLGK
jgi:hypothetical protein